MRPCTPFIVFGMALGLLARAPTSNAQTTSAACHDLSSIIEGTGAPTTSAPTTSAAEMAQERLRDEVLTAHRRGDHERALAAAECALAILSTGRLHGIIAREHLDLGHPAEALTHAEACTREVPAEQPSPERDTVLAWCRERASELPGRVGRVVVEIPSPPPGLRITITGRSLAVAQPGVAQAVDPGHAVVEATAPDCQPFRRELEVASGVSVTIPVALECSLASAPPPTAHGPIGIVIASVGAAALLTSGITWLVADRTCSDHTTTPGACTRLPSSDYQSVQTLDTVTTVGLVAGGLLVPAGVVIYLLGRRSMTARQESPHVMVTAGPGALGLAGTF